jgi:hypothetical protein
MKPFTMSPSFANCLSVFSETLPSNSRPRVPDNVVAAARREETDHNRDHYQVRTQDVHHNDEPCPSLLVSELVRKVPWSSRGFLVKLAFYSDHEVCPFSKLREAGGAEGRNWKLTLCDCARRITCI